jgi:hypothetical protein
MTPTRSQIKTPGHMGGENFERGFLLFIPQVPLPQFLELLLFKFYLPYGFFYIYKNQTLSTLNCPPPNKDLT